MKVRAYLLAQYLKSWTIRAHLYSWPTAYRVACLIRNSIERQRRKRYVRPTRKYGGSDTTWIERGKFSARICTRGRREKNIRGAARALENTVYTNNVLLRLKTVTAPAIYWNLLLFFFFLLPLFLSLSFFFLFFSFSLSPSFLITLLVRTSPVPFNRRRNVS